MGVLATEAPSAPWPRQGRRAGSHFSIGVEESDPTHRLEQREAQLLHLAGGGVDISLALRTTWYCIFPVLGEFWWPTPLRIDDPEAPEGAPCAGSESAVASDARRLGVA